MLDISELIVRRLAEHSRRVLPAEGRRAAVLIPLSQDATNFHVLFTRRTHTVEHHKGQISFPGGAVDPGDADLQETALRETHEEMGISPDHVQILGALDDVMAAVSGFIITPFVGLIPHQYPFVVSGAEIAEVLIVPLTIFRDPRNLRIETVQRGDQRAKVYFYRYHDHQIWGVTAKIMKDMINVVFGGGESS